MFKIRKKVLSKSRPLEKKFSSSRPSSLRDPLFFLQRRRTRYAQNQTIRITDGELTPAELLRIAKKNGFKAKRKKLELQEISDKYPLPALAHCRDGSFLVLLRLDPEAEKALVFSPASQKAEERTFAEFQKQCDNDFIIIRHKLLSSQVAFGFKWFLAEMSKYKRIIGEVLLRRLCGAALWPGL